MNVTSPISAAMGYGANALLRAAETRDADCLEVALGRADARFYLQKAGRWLSREEAAERPRLDFTKAEALERGADLSEAMLLGWTADTRAPRLAIRIPGELAVLPEGSEPAEDLRSLGTRGVLDPDVEGQLAQAQHFLIWHSRTRFCGKCGGPTVSEAGGYRRRCTSCGEQHFPRTDPVAIMLIHDGRGRCVLGRQPQFAPGMWSCLAGFVEPGETLEDAVRRETLEEAGITVGEVAYHLSQPWPFPGSLMIGCLGLASSETIVIGDAELEDCRWFDTAEVRAMLDRTHPDGLVAPMPFAIAHHLMRAFTQRPLG